MNKRNRCFATVDLSGEWAVCSLCGPLKCVPSCYSYHFSRESLVPLEERMNKLALDVQKILPRGEFLFSLVVYDKGSQLVQSVANVTQEFEDDMLKHLLQSKRRTTINELYGGS
jgi:hypothetical protein